MSAWSGLLGGGLGAAGLAAAPATGGASLLLSALPSIASFLGGIFTGGQPDMTPEQRRLMMAQEAATRANTQQTQVGTQGMQLGLARRNAQDPLFRALQLLAARNLPMHAQQGFDFSGLMNPISAPPLPGPDAASRPREDRPAVGRARPRPLV